MFNHLLGRVRLKAIIPKSRGGPIPILQIEESWRFRRLKWLNLLVGVGGLTAFANLSFSHDSNGGPLAVLFFSLMSGVAIAVAWGCHHGQRIKRVTEAEAALLLGALLVAVIIQGLLIIWATYLIETIHFNLHLIGSDLYFLFANHISSAEPIILLTTIHLICVLYLLYTFLNFLAPWIILMRL